MAKKQEWLKGWKVISIIHGKRVSCVCDGHRIKYPKNKIVGKPRGCGPLAVFNTRQNARNFLGKYDWRDTKIVKCLYIKSKYNYLWTPHISFIVLPIGTVCADKVKCLE